VDKFKALETFIAVAETGSFSGASRKLNISAPSVTRIISDLEAELGVKLLFRTTRVVTLTDTGQSYFETVKQITQDLSLADDSAKGAYLEPTGTLRITAPATFGSIYIMPIITAFLELYPKVNIEALFVDRIVSLEQERIDIAVRIGNFPDTSLMMRHVGEVTLHVCGSPNYFEKNGIPQKPEDLNKHSLIALSLSKLQNDWIFESHPNVRSSYKITFNSILAGLVAARSGWGLLRLLSYQIAPDIHAGRLQTVLHKFAPPPYPVHLLNVQGSQSSAKVRTFIDFASERLRANTFLNSKTSLSARTTIDTV